MYSVKCPPFIMYVLFRSRWIPFSQLNITFHSLRLCKPMESIMYWSNLYWWVKKKFCFNHWWWNYAETQLVVRETRLRQHWQLSRSLARLTLPHHPFQHLPYSMNDDKKSILRTFSPFPKFCPEKHWTFASQSQTLRSWFHRSPSRQVYWWGFPFAHW